MLAGAGCSKIYGDDIYNSDVLPPDEDDETGSLVVTLLAVGGDLDPDGASVSLDENLARHIGVDASIEYRDVKAGKHSIAISDVASNCSLAGDNPIEVDVTEGETAYVEIDLSCSPDLAALSLDKITIGMTPGASEAIEVTALDAKGVAGTWSVAVDDEGIVDVVSDGAKLIVTGSAIGDTWVRITSDAGLERDLEVRVYDPHVLDTGDLLLRYVDEFDWRWSDSGSTGSHDGGFWHPVAPEGWHALGSLGIQGYGSPNQNQWMLVVKDDDAGAIAAPTDYYREYDDSGGSADADGSFWTPICPDGYVSLGAVAQSGWGKPSLDDVVCVRTDLTVRGVAGAFIWNDDYTGADDYVGMWRIEIAEREDKADTRLYLDPGTFVATGSEPGLCVEEGCWAAPQYYPHLNVLAVDAPMLFDAGQVSAPTLTSYDEPEAGTEPFEAKAMLVPFTSVLSGDQIGDGTRVHEFVTESPFLRFEKTMQFHRLGWLYCGGSTTCELGYTVEKGIEETTSETFSHKVGISVTAEGGVKFLGTGGKMSVTVSYEFGYETSQSRAVLVSESWQASKPCPPASACAIWTDNTTFLVKKHLPSGGFAVLNGGQMSFDGGLSIWTDDYSEANQ